MNPAVVTVTWWFFVVVALGAHAMAILSAIQVRENEEEWYLHLIPFGLSMAGTGLLTSALTMAGMPWLALWAWRVAGGLTLATVSYSSVAVLSLPVSIRVVGSLAFVLALLVFGVGISSRETRAPPPVSVPSTDPASQRDPAAQPPKPDAPVDYGEVSRLLALALLAAVSLLFLTLFIRKIEQGGSLGIESQWGGIGGGIGGWRISTPLTYSLAAAVCGVLLLVLLPPRKAPTNASGSESTQTPKAAAPSTPAGAPDGGPAEKPGRAP